MITSFVSHRRQAERFICTAPTHKPQRPRPSPSTPPTHKTSMKILHETIVVSDWYAAAYRAVDDRSVPCGGRDSTPGLSDQGFYKVKDKSRTNHALQSIRCLFFSHRPHEARPTLPTSSQSPTARLIFSQLLRAPSTH